VTPTTGNLAASAARTGGSTVNATTDTPPQPGSTGRVACDRCKVLGFTVDERGKHAVCPACKGVGYTGGGDVMVAWVLRGQAAALETIAGGLDSSQPGWVSTAAVAVILREGAASLRRSAHELFSEAAAASRR
jgi:hypothetical protein